jgi:hypothetical protein
MRSRAATTVLALLLATASMILADGCGSGTKTVSVASAPVPQQTTSAPATSTQKASKSPTGTSTATTPTPTGTAGGTSAQSTTRTAPEPAFTQQESHAEGVSGAAALVRAKGFTPNDTSEYHSSQTLRVLLGTRTGSGDGYGQLAFFFLGDRYIGTDTKEPSATLKVLAQSDTEVTLAYPLYRKGDPLSTPSGGQATVRFQLDNGKLTPLGTIPPSSSSSGLSRF